MKRDMDLVRSILLKTEEQTRSFDADELVDAKHGEDEVAYHVYIMKQAGLLDATITSDMSGGMYATVEGLTWDGQDFLDAVRNDGVWHRIKRGLADGVKSVGFESIKSTAIAIGTAALKAQIGMS